MLVATGPVSVSPPPSTSSSASASASASASSSYFLNTHYHHSSFKGTVPIVAYSSAAVTTSSTKTHLSNLDRVLSKPSPPPPPPPPQPPETTHENNHADPSTSDHGNSVGGGGEGKIFNALSLRSGLFLESLLRRPPAADDRMMSPRSLNRLQRLLSESPRPSPRSCIAGEWRRYHGGESWDGLLDPLDPNLRRELLRYGEFVQSAYRAFQYSLPSTSSSYRHRHRHVVLPDRSYRPTCSLFATSSLAVPEWAHSHPSAPDWLTQRSSWVGFVAVCDSDREIARMGRRDIAVVLRGTATCHEWAENLRTSLVPLPAEQPSSPSPPPKVARGFLSLYETPGDHVPSLSSSIVDEVLRLMRLYEGEELSITVVGHSLGGALALLAADELRACSPRVPPIAVVSFGGPRVGNGAFADRLRGFGGPGGVNVLRVVNEGDVVTRVPGAVVGLQLPPHEQGGGYEHVGAELRVDSRDSPFLRPDAGPVFCHDLEAYLHLVDGFAASGREFRPDASRSLLRLLRHQRPSINKFYADWALALRLDRPPDPAAAPPEPYGYVASPT